uniref:Uncharacterized protein LOC111111887 n=1 Tax=Crassostrea virginica TaxID=6565 RepID=A0A8B8BN78_CRAVI|nr:uncharacterized protein LOC111111887 [Crassostrea virginica]
MENTEIRQTGDGNTYGVTHVLAKTTNYMKLHEVHLPGKFTGKFSSSERKFLFIKGYSQKEEGLIRIIDKSLVLDTQDNPIDSVVIKRFTNPPNQDIAVIKTKEKGERVSVKACVEKVSNILETPSSKRRIIKLRDSSGTIDLKVWGEMIHRLQFEEDQMVRIGCVTIDVFNNRASLNSNPSTTLEILNEEEEVEGLVDAACFDQDEMSILIRDTLFGINTDQMEQIFPTMDFIQGLKVKLLTKGRTIIEVTEVQQE